MAGCGQPLAQVAQCRRVVAQPDCGGDEGSIVAGAENVIRARSIPGRTASLSVRYEF